MSTTIEIDFPEAVLACLDLPPGSLPDLAKECLALGLFREGRLASGTAAQWLGISKVEFLDLLARRGVSVHRLSTGGARSGAGGGAPRP